MIFPIYLIKEQIRAYLRKIITWPTLKNSNILILLYTYEKIDRGL